MSKTIGLYKLDTNVLEESLKNKKGTKVFVQLPEGFQQYAIDIKHWLEESYHVKVILDAEVTYGACDLPSESVLQNLDIASIIQFGHCEIPALEVKKRSIPVLFINAQSTLAIEEVVKKSIPLLSGSRIGLVTTAQYLHVIKAIKSLLSKQGLTTIVGTGDRRIQSKGQILGCNFSAATDIADSIDSFLFVGSGFFHALGLILVTDKPVIIADPYTNQVIDSITLQEKKQQLLRQRYGAITFAKQAKTIGIIVGLKPGQIRENVAFNLQQKIVASNKKCLILATNQLHPSITDRFPFIDVFVSTACPRIAIDDYTAFKKPVITPIELQIALQELSWDEYHFDEIKG